MTDFKILSELGRGSYGTVFKVQSAKDTGVYVLKKILMKHMKQKH
jgi:serine/threonine protein kinase